MRYISFLYFSYFYFFRDEARGVYWTKTARLVGQLYFENAVGDEAHRGIRAVGFSFFLCKLNELPFLMRYWTKIE